jgi:hypothetical protein
LFAITLESLHLCCPELLDDSAKSSRRTEASAKIVNGSCGLGLGTFLHGAPGGSEKFGGGSAWLGGVLGSDCAQWDGGEFRDNG